MRRQWIFRGLAIFLGAVLLSGEGINAYGAEAVKPQKVENVYAKLGTDGTAARAYVVNSFALKEDGNITDYGSYSEVKNLTDEGALVQQGGTVSFSSFAGKFYYQGTLDKVELPWKFDITYELDGTKRKAEALGGAEGTLSIHLTTVKNPAADPVFYENYVMQISLTLDSETCTKIKAEGASINEAGANELVTFNVLPGKDADVTITADVVDFSMDGFSIAAVPYSMSIDPEDFDTSEMTGQFDELLDAVEELNTGTKKLKNGTADLSKGAVDLYSGGDGLLGGSREIRDGLREISENSGTIRDASAQIADALHSLNTSFGASDFDSLAALPQLPATLTEAAAGLKEIQGGLIGLREGFAASSGALDRAMQSAAAEPLTEEELTALAIAAAGDETAALAYEKLVASYQNLQVILGTYAQVKPGFDAVSAGLSDDGALLGGLFAVIGGIDAMSLSLSQSFEGRDLTGSLADLSQGLSLLDSNYQSFHEGLLGYTGGIDTLAGNYKSFHRGLHEYLDGVGELSEGVSEYADGVKKYADGMQEFQDGISHMPDEVQSRIDELMEQYNSADFDAVSFVDSRNKDVSSVQFVLSTAAIRAEKVKPESAQEKKEGFFERLTRLFTGLF